METELLEAIQRFDLINKSKSQLKDWRTIRKALAEVQKPAHNTGSLQCPNCKKPLYSRKVTYCMNDMCNYVEVDRSQQAGA
jgi:hypothetical protein